MRVAFCNFDFEPWRVDLASKLAFEFSERGHSCFYYGYKKNVREELEQRGAPIEYVGFPKFNSRKTALTEHFDWTPEELDFITDYNYRLNVVKKRRPSKQDTLFRKVHVFLQKLKDAQRRHQIDFFVVWGGIRFHERAVVAFAKHYDIPFQMLELGYFRPFTVTVEQEGLNDDNSLPRDEAFYEALYPGETIELSDITSPRTARRGSEAEEEASPESSDPSAAQSPPRSASAVPPPEAVPALEGPYVFVPLQVETDSQIIQYSPQLKSMRNLVAIVCEGVLEYNLRYETDLHVVFKPHPVDTSIALGPIEDRLRAYPHASMERAYTSAQLIAGAELVMTINSTVGLEALMQFKPVVTLGNAFYNLPRLVTHCSDYDTLPEALREAVTRTVDEEFILKYLKYLREEYFHEIYYKDADRASVASLVDRLLATVSHDA